MSKDLVILILNPVGTAYKPDVVYDTVGLSEVTPVADGDDSDAQHFIELQTRSVYAAFEDIKAYAVEKYQFDPAASLSYSMHSGPKPYVTLSRPNGDIRIDHKELAKLEKPHVHSGTYANVLQKYYPDYYGSAAGKILKPGYNRVTPTLIQHALTVLSQDRTDDTLEDLGNFLSNGYPEEETQFLARLCAVQRMAALMRATAFVSYE